MLVLLLLYEHLQTFLNYNTISYRKSRAKIAIFFSFKYEKENIKELIIINIVIFCKEFNDFRIKNKNRNKNEKKKNK